MKIYKVILSKAAEQQISQLSKPIANIIANKINRLSEEPRPTGCKKLKGRDDSYRIRSGVYRIIYKIQDGQLFVEVIRIAHRKDAYK